MSSTAVSAPAPQRLNTMRQRIQTLYRTAGEAVHRDKILSMAFEELSAALDTLHAAENDRLLQFDRWLDERSALEAEVKRYQELFSEAPIGYLITSVDGTIRMANAMASRLLQVPERRLLGRSLSLFIPDGRRRGFRADIANVPQHDQPQEWELDMQALDETVFTAQMIVAAVRGSDGQAVGLRWLLRDVSKRAGATVEPVAAPAAPVEQTAFQAECAFFADASVTLALISDLEATVTRIGHLAVGSVADACIIDITQGEGQGRQFVCATTPHSAGRETRSHWSACTGATSEAWPETTTRYEQREIDALLARHLANDSAAQMLHVLRGLPLARAIGAPLDLGSGRRGMLTLLSTSPTAWVSPPSLTLISEFARRMSTAIQRTC